MDSERQHESTTESSESDIFATWDRYPDAPSNDFARLVPFNHAAQSCFQQVVHRYKSEPAFFPYGKPFVHFEMAEATSANESFHSTTDEEPEDDSDTPWQPLTPAMMQEALIPHYRGFYRLNMLEPTPQNHGLGWVLGRGRHNLDVNFILTATPSAALGISSRQCRIQRLHSGAVLVISDSHEVFVGSHRLKRDRDNEQQPKSEYQHAIVDNETVITVAGLSYIFRMTGLPWKTDAEQLQRVFPGQVGLPQILLTPTPLASTRHVRVYHLQPAFAMGVSSTVCFATHKVTGQAYAVKAIIIKDKWTRQSVNAEISLLKMLNHHRICRLVESFEQAYNSGFSLTSPSEAFLVMSTAGRHSLTSYITGSLVNAEGIPDGSVRNIFSSEVLHQCSDALSYLHQKGIMHRDVKPDNIGVASITPTEVVLLDFGHSVARKTSLNHNRGTIRYLAPEVMALKAKKSQEPYSNAIDIWALGLTYCQVRFQFHGDGTDRGVRDAAYFHLEQSWGGRDGKLKARSTQVQVSINNVDNDEERDTKCRALAGRMLESDVSKRISARNVYDALEGEHAQGIV